MGLARDVIDGLVKEHHGLKAGADKVRARGPRRSRGGPRSETSKALKKHGINVDDLTFKKD